MLIEITANAKNKNILFLIAINKQSIAKKIYPYTYIA